MHFFFFPLLFFLLAGETPVPNPNPVNAAYKKDKLPDGETKYYFADGSVEQVMHAKDGDLDGEYKIFYKGGILREKYHFVKGHFNDTNRMYNPDGTITEEEVYRNDTLLYFRQADYFKTGEMSWERYLTFDKDSLKLCPFLKSRQVIAWIWFDPTETFKYLPSHGKSIYYFKNGKISDEYELVNNMNEGLYTSYYDDGKIYTKGNWHLDKQEGLFITYNDDGTEHKRVEYKDGKKIK